ncbi:TPA: fimbrial protein, partial [Escherichia coli]|nr:fimbrial protein [Escherichia coli]
MKSIIIAVFFLSLQNATAAIQRTVFTADIVASACHVVVDADSTGNSG